MPEQTEELRWSAVRQSLEQALDLEPARRDEFLASLETAHPALAQRVRSLLSRASEEGLSADDPAPLKVLAEEIGVPPDCAPGAPLGRYTAIRLLGVGGMGSVYEAFDPMLGRSVAIKVIHPAILSAHTLRRFEDEAMLLARLRHPAIAQVYESGWVAAASPNAERLPFIAMEFVPEATALTRYASDHSLGFWPRIQLVLAVLDAVQHAHQRGVIHRDLKPANILVDGSGNAKVIDFGIALAQDPREEAHSARLATITGRAAGTLRYMSPEQCGREPGRSGPNSPDSDVRTDVYALGVILYELIEGRSPYAAAESGSLTALVEQVSTASVQPAAFASAPDAITRRDLRAIVCKALAREPAARFPTAAAMADDLQRLVRHEPVSARPQSLWQDARLFARRNRVLVIAGIAIFVSLSIGAVAATIGLVHARKAQFQAEQQADRARRVASFFSRSIRSVGAAAVLDRATRPLDSWLFGHIPWGPARRVGEGARVVDLLHQAADRLPAEFSDDPLTRAQLAIELAGALNTLYATEQAAELAHTGWSIRRELLGDDHEDTLRALVLWAQLHPLDQERVELIRESVARMQARFGSADVRTHEVRLRLIESLKMPHDPPGGPLSSSEITRDMRESVALADAAIGQAIRDFGPDSYQVWQLRFAHGDSVVQLKEPDGGQRGLRELEEAVAAMERIGGSDSFDVAGSRFTLGGYYIGVNDARAEELLRLSVDGYLRSIGPSGGATYEGRSALHMVLLRRGKLPESEAVARDQLRDVREALGDGSDQTIKAKARLARSLVWQKKDLDEAESLARQASQDGLAYDEKSPSGDWDAYFRAIWAGTIRLRGDAPESERMVRSLLEARKKFTGRAGWTDGLLWMELAEALLDQDRMPESAAALAQAELQLAKLKDPGHPLHQTFKETQTRLISREESKRAK